MNGALSAAVVVPTFRRPQHLSRCLQAISRQRRPPDEVLVVVRDSDTETQAVLAALGDYPLPMQAITTTVPGLVQALNAALRVVQSDIIAITDDDAEPHEDWLERIIDYFGARNDLAGVGGRDYLHNDGKLVRGKKRVVGRVPRFRSHVGNHHLGFGEPREVDILKGVNGAYRVDAIRGLAFDERLRGTGAQVHWEIGLGLALRRRGWKLLYDPKIAVDHFLGPRYDEDQRRSFNALAMRNMAFNEAFVRLEFLRPLERILFMGWAICVGDRELPGCVQFLRFLPMQRYVAVRRFVACALGRRDAWRAVRSRNPMGLSIPPATRSTVSSPPTS